MTYWRKIDRVWCFWPNQPKGLIEIIGGSYLGANPQISYRQLIESLYQEKWAIHAWSYIPILDHQSQAIEAWNSFRIAKKVLINRINEIPSTIRLGHSLGCKLHLLAPDGGRNSQGLITLAFNNFSAVSSIPMIKELAPKLGFKTEFTPSPRETMQLIANRYIQPYNLLVGFKKDSLDQSNILLKHLKKRQLDESKGLILPGDHLTPASTGLRKNLLGELAKDITRVKNLNRLMGAISCWSSNQSSTSKTI